jgi:hypothetical protein
MGAVGLEQDAISSMIKTCVQRRKKISTGITKYLIRMQT